jgi:hypothetical protein
MAAFRGSEPTLRIRSSGPCADLTTVTALADLVLAVGGFVIAASKEEYVDGRAERGQDGNESRTS